MDGMKFINEKKLENHDIGDIPESFELKTYERSLEESEKLERANQYWGSRLTGETRIAIPQNERCEFTIVVPVYNEDLNRILKQLDSIRNQKIDHALFEVIYVVNNDLDTANIAKDVFERNQRMITELRNIKDLPVFVIDKSSPGSEIQACNIGKARNRGVAEASLRFYENKKNGIIIQTDADTYFEDQEYLSKLKSITEKQPDVIGIAGGIVWEFNPDTNDEKEIAELKEKMAKLILVEKYTILDNFLKDGTVHSSVNEDNFSGPHMISRSFESAVIGGLIDASKGEDPRFGQDLGRYAVAHHQKVIGQKDILQVITALRESDRTGSSFKKMFDNIDLTKLPEELPIRPRLSVFKNIIYEILKNIASGIDDIEKLKAVCSNEKGELLISPEAFDELVGHAQKVAFEVNDPFYPEWEKRNAIGTNEESLIDYLYYSKYAPIILSQEVIDELIVRVQQKPGGDIVVRNLNNVIDNIRLPRTS